MKSLADIKWEDIKVGTWVCFKKNREDFGVIVTKGVDKEDGLEYIKINWDNGMVPTESPDSFASINISPSLNFYNELKDLK